MRKAERDAAATAALVIRKQYSSVWPVILEPSIDYLIAARRSFDGDLDRMLVLAVIELMSIANFRKLEAVGIVASYDDLKDRGYSNGLSRPLNVESIALFSGIPRETVRRKVLLLIERGWVHRDDKGMLTATATAARDLEGANQQLFAVIGAIYGAVGKVVGPD
ncbi:MAG: hypothetical protein ACRC14_07960 [Paracoccaceae bacterium]